MQGIVVGATFVFMRYCEAEVGGHKNDFEYWYKWKTFTVVSTHRYASTQCHFVAPLYEDIYEGSCAYT